MPVVDTLMVRLDTILQETGCYYGISLVMPFAISEQATQKIASDTGRARLLEACESRDWEVLMHSTSPAMMKSLMRQTVAYDSKRGSQLATYNDDTPGTYVAALAIAGRDGAFLSENEIESLINHFREYHEATKYYNQHKKWDGSAAGQAHKAVVARVHGAGFKGGAPDLLGNSCATLMVGDLIAMFKRRVRPDLDPAGTTFQRQSPLMIGCTSKTIRERVACHDVMANGPKQTTWTWAFTIFCIERCLGLGVEVVSKPIIIAFGPGNVSLSEIGITVLARSLVTQKGFNIVPGGGRGDPKSFDWSTPAQIVTAHCPWHGENLRRSLEYIDSAEKVLKAIELVNKSTELLRDGEVQLLDVQASIAQLKVDLSDSIRTLDEVESKSRDLHAKREKLRQLQTDLRHRLEVSTALLKAVDELQRKKSNTAASE